MLQRAEPNPNLILYCHYRKFRKAHVVGNDLSAIQPRWVPPNLEFVVEDFENEWLFEPDHFDFIHARTIAGYYFPHYQMYEYISN